jgi:hypothetical protein
MEVMENDTTANPLGEGTAAPASGSSTPSTPPGVPQRSDAATAPAPRPTPAAATKAPAASTAPAAKKTTGASKSTGTKKAPRIERGKPVDPAIDRLFPLPDIPAGASAELAEKAAELRRWWVNQLVDEWPMVVDKAIKYGGGDLDLMGEGMKMLVGSEGPAGGTERALTFYLMGKVSRLLGAFERRLRPGRDSWVDAHVYAMMGLRVHDEGSWF